MADNGKSDKWTLKHTEEVTNAAMEGVEAATGAMLGIGAAIVGIIKLINVFRDDD